MLPAQRAGRAASPSLWTSSIAEERAGQPSASDMHVFSLERWNRMN